MKCLKEPLPRPANGQDNIRGVFVERRFKSVAMFARRTVAENHPPL
jgi:hypothetical protein